MVWTGEALRCGAVGDVKLFWEAWWYGEAGEEVRVACGSREV